MEFKKVIPPKDESLQVASTEHVLASQDEIQLPPSDHLATDLVRSDAENIEEARKNVEEALTGTSTNTDNPTRNTLDDNDARNQSEPKINVPSTSVSSKRSVAKGESGELPKKVKVRHATASDMPRLAEIDICLFEKAYGEELPDKDEVEKILTKRFNNNPTWMFVSEVDGVVEGFVSAFRTNTPIEGFVSWENSTADGTLDGKVEPSGDFVYVTNMTIKHEAVELGAEEMLLANLFANGIRDGVKYGYFVSRMPYFGRWLEDNDITTRDPAELQELADTYANMRDEDGRRIDSQLRMYEELGYQLKKVYPNAFKDAASLDFGVVCKAIVPPGEKLKKIKPLRIALAGALRIIARNPNMLKKVLDKIG